MLPFFYECCQRSKRLIHVLWHGASPGVTKKRTGFWVGDLVSRFWYNLIQFLTWVDTLLFFRDRPYQTPVGQVKTKNEKKVANFLFHQGIKFEYEPHLRLKRSVAMKTSWFWHLFNFRIDLICPDFYLLDYNIFIEVWGPMDNPDYHRRRFSYAG